MKKKARNLFNANGFSMVIGAYTLSLFAATISSADVCTEAQAVVEYDSSDGHEPDTATPS